MKCMHPNGIAYDIIKKKLPIINDEMSRILANVVDFEIFFEAEEKRLNIFIKHPKYCVSQSKSEYEEIKIWKFINFQFKNTINYSY